MNETIDLSDNDDITEPFPARYEGRCGLCDEHIFEGDMIIRTDGEYCHAECYEC